MPAKQSLTRKEIARLIGPDPLFLEFMKPFPNLLSRKKGDISAGFEQIAKKLSATRRSGVMQFRLTKGRRARNWSLAIDPKACRVIDSHIDNPDVEVIVGEDTWQTIATGQISPMEAFLSGKLRFRGDVEMARSIVRRICKR